MRRKSTFNLMNAANYLRLGFQSMSRDQDEAIREIEMVLVWAGDDQINRVLGLANLCAGRARRVVEEKSVDQRAPQQRRRRME